VKCRRHSPAVQEQDRLAAFVGDPPEPGKERCRERVSLLAAEIDDAHGR
jgi:hypothetical protein